MITFHTLSQTFEAFGHKIEGVQGVLRRMGPLAMTIDLCLQETLQSRAMRRCGSIESWAKSLNNDKWWERTIFNFILLVFLLLKFFTCWKRKTAAGLLPPAFPSPCVGPPPSRCGWWRAPRGDAPPFGNKSYLESNATISATSTLDI